MVAIWVGKMRKMQELPVVWGKIPPGSNVNRRGEESIGPHGLYEALRLCTLRQWGWTFRIPRSHEDAEGGNQHLFASGPDVMPGTDREGVITQVRSGGHWRE